MGAPGANSDAGAVHVFEFKESTGWQEVQILTASDGMAGDKFGLRMAIDGDDLLIAALPHVYFFQRIAGVWQEQPQRLATPEATGIAMDGQKALIGKSRDSNEHGIRAGIAHAYNFDSMTGMWDTLPARVFSDDPEAEDQFGNEVAMSGNKALISAYLEDGLGTNNGAAYVFTFDTDMKEWNQDDKLVALNGQAFDLFGWDVAIEGSTALVGAFGDDDLGSLAGAVYSFREEAGGWVQKQKITVGTAGDHLGRFLAMSQGTAMLSAPGVGDLEGAVYRFTLDIFTGLWAQESPTITGLDTDADDLFGWDIDIDGSKALIGAFFKDNFTGAAYVFAKSGQAQATSMSEQVENLFEGGTLNAGQANALQSPLDQVQEILDQQGGLQALVLPTFSLRRRGGHTPAEASIQVAINLLGAFINKVESFLNAGILTPDQGQILIGKAETLIGDLETIGT